MNHHSGHLLLKPVPFASRSALKLGLAALIVILTLPGTSHAGNGHCAYDNTTRVMTFQLFPNTQLTLQRSFDDKILISSSPAITPQTCVDRTVFEVNKIVVNGLNPLIHLDLRAGPLAPGHTDEPGRSDEIEMELNDPGENKDPTLRIWGSTSPDRYVFGSQGANLNAAETSGVDKDVTTQLGEGTILQVDLLGGFGNDRLMGGGGSGTGAVFRGPFSAAGGSGNDLVEGGAFPGTISPASGDQLTGGRGRDTLTYQHASGGVFVDAMEVGAQETFGAGVDSVAEFENLTGSRFFDLLEGTNSNNALRGLGGNDDLYGRGGADKLNGGRANDECIGGPGSDDFAKCETVQQGGT